MEDAKKSRSHAKRLLTMALNHVESALSNNCESDIIQNRMSKAENKMDDVIEKHQEYLGLAYPDEEDISAEDIEWFNKVSGDYDNVESLARQKINNSKKEDSTKLQVKQLSDEALERKNLKRKCEYEEALVSSAFSNLMGCIQDSTSTIDTIKLAQKDAKDKLDKYCELQREYSSCLTEEQMKECLEEVKEIMSKFSELNISAGKCIQLRNVKVIETKPDSYNHSIFKLERMKLPSFDGNIRDYPRFISDFHKYIMPNIKDDTSASYILRSCLSGKALEDIRNVDDDIDKMLERLKQKFGHKSKLADVIMNDIKHMRQINDNDEKGFIKMVNLIENSYNDLEKIGMEQAIANSTIVSMIEEKLPKMIKSQWCVEIIKVSIHENNKFTSILEFLLMHKNAIEYGSNELRLSTSQRSGSTNYSQNMRPENQNLNTNNQTDPSKTPKEVCWIHKSESGVNHPIWGCKDFQDMTVSQRLALTKSNAACKRCLLMKCPGSKSNGECWGRFKCRVKGCNQLHNKLLHQESVSTSLSSSVEGSVNHALSESFPGLDTAQTGAAILPIQNL